MLTRIQSPAKHLRWSVLWILVKWSSGCTSINGSNLIFLTENILQHPFWTVRWQRSLWASILINSMVNSVNSTGIVESCDLEYSISQTSRNPEWFIWFLGHLALDQSKKLTVSRISNVCLCRTNFPGPWAFFSHYFELFLKFPPLSSFFFSNPSCAIAAIVPARMDKNSQIIFCSFSDWRKLLINYAIFPCSIQDMTARFNLFF